MGLALEEFEYLAYTRQHEEAAKELLAFLLELDSLFGAVHNIGLKLHQPSAAGQLDQHVLTRIASAVSCLFADVDFQISPDAQSLFLAHQRWLALIFASCPFVNADHILSSLDLNKDGGEMTLKILEKDLIKFCMLYFPESEVKLDLDALWGANSRLAISLALTLVAPRFIGSLAAHNKREAVLPWLAQKLLEVSDLEALPLSILHDVYMHCSYADRSDKHDIKRSINCLIVKKLKNITFIPSKQELAVKATKKPILLVVLEWFSIGHSIYRTHSLSMEGAKEQFYTIGFGYTSAVDNVAKQVFDEFIELDSQNNIFIHLQQIQDLAQKRGADALYMPSVGMFPLTMFLANLRVAPFQAMGLGHPATTHATEIDYVVVEEDYIGDPDCFSEKLLAIPKDAMPYRPRADALDLEEMPPAIVKGAIDLIQIVICSTSMKINPHFLEVCAEIARKSPIKVHFQILIGQSVGIICCQIERVIRRYLGEHATIHRDQPYAAYMKVIASCDMFINPFPFGNTNGIVDVVTAGLVGVCKTGREVHEHIDQGMFERLNFPSWTVARTTDEYVDAVIRMANNCDERDALKKELSGIENVQKLFKGRKNIMGEIFAAKIRELKC